jgi:hypothetical protein
MDSLPLPEVWLGLSAFAGSLVYIVFRPEPTWRRCLAVVMGGCACGYFVSSVTCEYFEWRGEHACRGLAALGGLVGMIGAKSAIACAESTLTPKFFTDLIRKWLGPATPATTAMDPPGGKPPSDPFKPPSDPIKVRP